VHVFRTELISVQPSRGRGQKKIDIEEAAGLRLLGIEIPDDALDFTDQLNPSSAIHPTSLNLGHHQAAWRTIRSVRHLVSQRDWEHNMGWSVVVTKVFDVGEQYKNDEVTEQIEVDWKFDSYAALNLKYRL
jgi:hypothetical protein